MPRINVVNPEKQIKSEIPEFDTGDIVRVHQIVREMTDAGKERERIQIFEGLVIAKKGGKQPSATFMVRKISSGVGVERIFPLHSPLIAKVEVVKKQNVRQSKIYYVRNRLHSQARVRKGSAK